MQTIESLVLKSRGKIHMIGGDSLLAEIMEHDLFMSSFISTQINLACSFCLGLGSDPVKAYLALKFAKSIAPGTIVKTEAEVNIVRFKKMNTFGDWEEVSE